MATAYYKSQLSNKEKILYEEMWRGLQRFEEEIELTKSGFDALDKAFDAIISDVPELFFIKNDYSFSLCGDKSLLRVDFLYPYDKAQAMLKKLRAERERITAPCKQMTKLQAARYLHDYLADRLWYEKEKSKECEAYTIVGALLNGKCVCDGFAKAYKFLCDGAGVTCFRVVGEARGGEENSYGPHAWNMVCVDGNHYHVDVTFDKKEDRPSRSNVHLFMSSLDTAQTYIPSADFPLPYCSKSLSPAHRVDRAEELTELILGDSKKGITFGEYLFLVPMEREKLMDMLTKNLAKRGVHLCDIADSCYSEVGKRTSRLSIYFKRKNAQIDDKVFKIA